MSLAVMGVVWESLVPGNLKLPLLALADWANDDGVTIYATKGHVGLATRCTVDDRTIRRAIAPEWQEQRHAAQKRARYRCQVCYSKGPLDVHHRTYERRGEEWASDLTVLCRNCHSGHHGKPVGR